MLKAEGAVPTSKPQITTYVEPYVHLVIKWMADRDDRTMSKFVERALKKVVDDAISSGTLPERLISEANKAKEEEEGE